MNPDTRNALETLLAGNLNVEAYDLEELASWCRDCWPESALVRDFKSQLQTAIDHPGTVTPKLYTKWTSDASFKTQNELQKHLREIWEACFSVSGGS